MMILFVKNGGWYFCEINFSATQFIDKRMTGGLFEGQNS